jgi:hypothetical protein
MNEKEFQALCERRNDVDFEAFNLLREMQDEGVLTEDCLIAGLSRTASGLSVTEAREMAKHFVETFESLSDRRRRLDDKIVKASVTVKS